MTDGAPPLDDFLTRLALKQHVDTESRAFGDDYGRLTTDEALLLPMARKIVLDEEPIAVASEEQGGGSSTTETSQYRAYEWTLDASQGDDYALHIPDDAKQNGGAIDLGFTADAVDLRFDDEIVVAFAAPDGTSREIRYRSGDTPVSGRPAQTQYIWVRPGPNATGTYDVHLDAYRDPRAER